MGKTLEKVFLEKLNNMPVSEVEVQPPSKGKSKKSRTARTGSAGATGTRKRTIDSQSSHTVTSSNDALSSTTLEHSQPTDSIKPTSNGQNTVSGNAVIATPVAQINNSHVQVLQLLTFSFRIPVYLVAFFHAITATHLLLLCNTCSMPAHLNVYQ